MHEAKSFIPERVWHVLGRDAPADNTECVLDGLAQATDALARSCKAFIHNVDKLLTQGGCLSAGTMAMVVDQAVNLSLAPRE